MKLFWNSGHYSNGGPSDVGTQPGDDRLIAYLLGNLRGKDRARLEQQYFQHDDQFEQLCAMEDELIDRYLRGDLSNRELHQFERHFLASPRRRERVQSARALMEAVAPTAVRPRRTVSWQIPWKGLTWAFGCSTLLLLAGLPLLIRKNVNLQQQLEVAHVALERSTQPETKSAIPSVPLAISFVLAPVQRGFESANRLLFPAQAQIVNFSIELPTSSYSTYRAVFRTPEGDQVGTSTDIATHASPDGISAAIRVPAAIFPSGTYILSVQGSRSASDFQDVKSYSFTVVRR